VRTYECNYLVSQPRAAAELSRGSLDLSLLTDIENVDTPDLLSVVAGAAAGDPEQCDLVAAVEPILGIEVKRRQLAGGTDNCLPRLQVANDGSWREN